MNSISDPRVITDKNVVIGTILEGCHNNQWDESITIRVTKKTYNHEGDLDCAWGDVLNWRNKALAQPVFKWERMDHKINWFWRIQRKKRCEQCRSIRIK